MVEEHAPFFDLRRARTGWPSATRSIGPALRDLLAGTYRGARRSQQGHEGLDALEVTLAADVLTFTRN